MTALAPSYLDSILPKISAWTAPTMPGSVLDSAATSPVTSANLPGSTDLLTRLFGGADTTEGGILSPEDVRAARNAALFHTGLSILANSGPAPYRRGLGEILANGLLAGQKDYQDESQRILASKGAALQQGQLNRMAAIAQKYSGKTLDLPTLQSLMTDLASNGEAGPASAVSSYLSNLLGGSTKGMQVKAVNTPGQPGYDPKLPTGTPVIHVVDSQDPSKILATYPGEPSATANYEDALTNDRMIGLMQRERDAFIHRNDYTKEAQNYDLAKSSIAQAAAGNPEAYKSAILGYAAVADPRAQIRLGVLQYVQQLDPSFRGTYEQAWDKLIKGGLPPDFIQGMNRVLDSIHQTNARKYTLARQAELKRHSGWRDYAGYLPEPEEIFGPGFGGAPAASDLNGIMTAGR